jgi:hypothetical protein
MGICKANDPQIWLRCINSPTGCDIHTTPSIDLFKQAEHGFILRHSLILSMWPSFHPLFSVAAGLVGNFQHSFNTSDGHVKPLSGNQYAEFIPYIEFARAAYCTPNKIVGWKCGGWFFSSYTPCLDILIGTANRGLRYASWLCANIDRW